MIHFYYINDSIDNIELRIDNDFGFNYESVHNQFTSSYDTINNETIFSINGNIVQKQDLIKIKGEYEVISSRVEDPTTSGRNGWLTLETRRVTNEITDVGEQTTLTGQTLDDIVLFSGITPNEAAQISILKNNGDGTWGADVIAADGIYGHLELVNSDGSTELISSSGVNISNLYDLEISDVDNNGYQDLLVFNSEAMYWKIMVRIRTGTIR